MDDGGTDGIIELGQKLKIEGYGYVLGTVMDKCNGMTLLRMSHCITRHMPLLDGKPLGFHDSFAVLLFDASSNMMGTHGTVCSSYVVFSVGHSGLGLLVNTSARVPHPDVRRVFLETIALLERGVWQITSRLPPLSIVDARSPDVGMCLVTPRPLATNHGAPLANWDFAIVLPPTACDTEPSTASPSNIARMAIFAAEMRCSGDLDSVPWCMGEPGYQHRNRTFRLDQAYTTSKAPPTLPKTEENLRPIGRSAEKSKALLAKWVGDVTLNPSGQECCSVEQVLADAFGWTWRKSQTLDGEAIAAVAPAWTPSVDTVLGFASQVLPEDCLANEEVLEFFVDTLLLTQELKSTTSLAAALHVAECVWFQRQKCLRPPLSDFSGFGMPVVAAVVLGLLQMQTHQPSSSASHSFFVAHGPQYRLDLPVTPLMLEVLETLQPR